MYEIDGVKVGSAEEFKKAITERILNSKSDHMRAVVSIAEGEYALSVVIYGHQKIVAVEACVYVLKEGRWEQIRQWRTLLVEPEIAAACACFIANLSCGMYRNISPDVCRILQRYPVPLQIIAGLWGEGLADEVLVGPRPHACQWGYA